MITLGFCMKRMAATSFSRQNSSIGMGDGPMPFACTRSPQKGWSPKNGTIVVGHCVKQSTSQPQLLEKEIE